MSTNNTKIEKFRAIWLEIQSHEKSALFSAASSHNPDLQMSLDAVKLKMDNQLYNKKPRDFVKDMTAVFTVEAESSLASAASSFKILLQCLLDKHSIDKNGRQVSTKRQKRSGAKGSTTSTTTSTNSSSVFDLVHDFEEELSSGFLFEGGEDDDEEDDEFFGHTGTGDVSEDLIPLSFCFDQLEEEEDSVGAFLDDDDDDDDVDSSSPALYSELLDAYVSWDDWQASTTNKSGGDAAGVDDEEHDEPDSSSGDSSSAGERSSVPATKKSSRGKRQRSASLRMSWTKEELLFKITNDLPAEKLEGLVLIVNPTIELTDMDDEDLEFDINALDDETLLRLQEYVCQCLAEKEEEHGNESMLDICTEQITSPRKKVKNTRSARKSRNNAKSSQHQAPLQSPTSSKRATRRKNASPAKTRAPVSKKVPQVTNTQQVIQSSLVHLVQQDEDFNYIPHSRGARLNTLVPEAFEVFRSEEVIKVHKSASESDLEEEVDIV
jgi:hypothetical protein